MQALTYAEPQELCASWMRLIQAVGLKVPSTRQVQRFLVDSNLDVDPVTIECDWKSLVLLALGLGVSPLDTTLRDLGEGTVAVSEQNLRSTALRSDTSQRLINIRWLGGTPYLELTEQCGVWSIRRALAFSFHIITRREGKREVLHFVPATAQTGGKATAQICDCKNTVLSPVESGIFRNIHCAIAWVFYFEELRHQVPSEIIPTPQSLLLLQFDIIEQFRQMPKEALDSRISTVFPRDSPDFAKVVSTLMSTWTASEHQELISGLGNQFTSRDFRRLGPVTSPPPTSRQSVTQPLDAEKAFQSSTATKFAPSLKRSSEEQATDAVFQYYTTIQSSPIFKTLFLAYSPSAFHATKSFQLPSDTTVVAPTATIIDIDSQSKPEAILARLLIALSAIRDSTAPKGWVTSIASGQVKYKLGEETAENMVRKLMGYEGRKVKIE